MAHDSCCKLSFSHPETVTDLLRGFVREDWVKEAEFSSLKLMNAGYVAGYLCQWEFLS